MHMLLCVHMLWVHDHIAAIDIFELGLGEIINQISNYSQIMKFIWIGCLF